MTVRRALLLVHRWLGLATAPLQLMVGATGVVLLVDLGPAWGDPIAEFHQAFLGGEFGKWLMFWVSVVAIVLQGTGLWLWWPPQPLRLRTDRGWWRFGYDLHNLSGILTLPITVMLAATAVGRGVFREYPPPEAIAIVRTVVSRLHTAGGFPVAIKVIYAIGSAAYVLQAITGVMAWWRPQPSRAPR
ncbi:MAG: PepSY-associated TM helix domain-containing protein [Vicinamibacterales bacterium]